MAKRLSIPIFIFTLIFFALFFVWPICQVLNGAFYDNNGNFTFGFIAQVFQNEVYVEGLTNALSIAFCSTLLALCIGLPLARIADKYNFPGKTIFMGLILLPIMLPPFVGAIGIRQLLGPYGAVNVILQKLHILSVGTNIDWLGGGQFWGIIIINAFSLYPILYLNILASLSNIDPAMEEAAQNLGCASWKKFLRITLPLIRPGIFAGCTIVFIWSFTDLGVPLIFDYSRITSVQIFHGLKNLGNDAFPFALVVVLFLVSLIVYGLGKGFFGRNPFAMMAKANQAKAVKFLGPWGKFACTMAFLMVIFVALLPHLSVILVSFSADWYQSILPANWSFGNYEIALGSHYTIPSIKNSLFYAGCATVLNVFLGIGIAFVVVRSKMPGRGLLDAMAMLPLTVPGIVMAFGYLAMSQEGSFFAFLNPVDNPTGLLIIAYAVRKLPFMVRSAVSGLQQISDTYEEAAQNLGCSPLKSSIKITIPLIIANLMAGGLLVFSQSMLEVSDSLILAQKQEFYPITKAIYALMNLLGDGPFIACALGVWAMTFLGVTIIGVSMLLGRNLGSIFKV